MNQTTQHLSLLAVLGNYCQHVTVSRMTQVTVHQTLFWMYQEIIANGYCPVMD